MNITNEKSKPYGIYCGGPYKKGATGGVIGNYARLHFHSDASVQKRGFLIHFSTFPLPSEYKKIKKLSHFIFACRTIKVSGFSNFKLAMSAFGRPNFLFKLFRRI